jgi:nicotinate phosphoribosyltransferase
VYPDIYKPSLSMLTDLYELTMAAGYWKLGRQDDEAVFHLYFRRAPFGGGVTLAAGLEAAISYLANFAYTAKNLDYLRSLDAETGRARIPERAIEQIALQTDASDEEIASLREPAAPGTPLFDPGFIDYLATLPPGLRLDVDAVPEGTAVFPHEPLLRVHGPLLAAQLVESALLNLINFPTLVATKAAAVVAATGGAPVLEFGLRRAQGPDGALTASRSAYLGGCAATSNVLAGELFDIPVRGTHAHSWILSFADEQTAFDAYAKVMPANSTLLVDTYNTLDGVRHAIETGRRMREAGHELRGIRLDSGDLAYLSVEARDMLDAAGFPDAKITASNDLDPEVIASLHEQGARIDIWGVGTRLVTAYDQPALGGVYKLTAIREQGRPWRLPVKISDETAKVSVPGILAVRRFYDANGRAAADMIWDEMAQGAQSDIIVDPSDDHRRRVIEDGWRPVELLVPVFRRGRLVYDAPPLDTVRAHAAAELASLHPAVRRRLNPHRYPAGLELGLYRRRDALIESAVSRQRGGAILESAKAS